jgi:uncharacterized protein YjdB
MRWLTFFLTFTFTLLNCCNLNAQCPIVPGYITGADSVCLNSFDTLRNHAATPGGSWRSRAQRIQFLSDTAGVDTIRFKGIVAGNDTIVYTITNICGSDSALFVVRINALPTPGEITGPTSVCVGAQITLSDLTGTPGGYWSSSDVTIATVDPLTGVVTGTGDGHVIIQYSGSNACGSIPDLHGINVNADPLAIISPSVSSVCLYANALMNHTGSFGSGTWSSANPAIATINAVTGVIGGVTVGTTIITYITATTSCGTDTATMPVAVNPLPYAGSITAVDSFCLGTVTVATATQPSGVWSFHYGFASLAAFTATTATLYGSYHGYDTLYYAVSNSCGVAITSRPIRIATLPTVGFILAYADSICEGNITTLTNPTGDPGGIWGHTGANVSVSPEGIVTALTPGTDQVFYTISNSCGAIAATRPITVNALPHAGSITGPSHVCVTASVALYDTTGTPGGSWSCSAWGTIDTTGVFTATAAGTTTITYTASTLCGTERAYYNLIIDPLPDAVGITGPGTLCAGTTGTFSNTVPSGSWSTNYPAIASINAGSGVLTAITAGAVTVTYSVINSCGTTAVIYPVTIETLPAMSPITGIASLCPGDTSVLTSGPAGGIWSASNGYATISSSGLLTGVSAGVDTISYSITNSCGTATALRIATVYPVPGTDTISGSSIACIGLPVTLTAVVPGGTWTSAGGHTTVAAGVVYGIATGVDTIRYAESNSCGSATLTHLMTVHDTVSVSVTASVSPNDTICGAAPVTLTATPVNGGSSPSVVWYNGAVVLGTGISLSYTPSDGDVVYCIMMSNAVCPTPDTAISNNIGLEVYPHVTPVVTVTASPSDTVAFIGQPITFTATLTNCGSSPVYQWYENGTAIAGATNATYTTSAAGSDAYYCIAACDTPCAIAVYNHSNVVTLYTGRVDVPGVGNSIAQYSIAPNPNTGVFILDGHGIRSNEAIRYSVLDVAGRQVISGSWQPVNGRVRNEVVLPDVAAGQYILRVFDGSAVVIFRIDVLK